MKDKINSAKNRVIATGAHVVRNRGKYGFAAGAATMLYLVNKQDRVAQWNEFLEEKGLTEEFYLAGE